MQSRAANPTVKPFFLGEAANTTLRAMHSWIKYDYACDLAWLGLVGTIPPIPVASMHTLINRLHDIVRMVTEPPGQLTRESVGTGSSHHVTCERLSTYWKSTPRHRRIEVCALLRRRGGR